jgi:hypothetical protein
MIKTIIICDSCGKTEDMNFSYRKKWPYENEKATFCTENCLLNALTQRLVEEDAIRENVEEV